MDMKRLRWWMALALALAMVFGSTAVAFARDDDEGKGRRGWGAWGMPPGLVVAGSVLGSRFADWQPGFWGNEALARMAVKGIIRGNPDHTIAPHRFVTRLEAAVMLVRLLGLEPVPVGSGRFTLRGPGGDLRIDSGRDEFEIKFKGRGFRSEIEFEDGRLIPTWGRGYLLAALQHGFLFFDGARLNPMAPLNRLEAAIMLVKAAGLEDEALNRAGAQLSFTDGARVPSRLRGYIAVAAERGYITGYPDGSFQPHRLVTRVEWASMLDRLDRQQTRDGRQVKGTITAVNLSVNGSVPTISMTTPVYPGGVTYQVDDTAVFFVNRREASIADLRVGDQAIVQLSEDRKILMVTVLAGVQQQGPTGYVTAFAAPSAGVPGSISIQATTGAAATTYPVLPDATVLLGSAPGTFADVRVGDRVTLTLRGQSVSRIAIDLEVLNVSGTVASVGTVNGVATIGLTTAAGQSVSYPVADWAVITNQAGASLTLSDIHVGDAVDVRVERGRAVRITLRGAAATETRSGAINSLDLGNNSFVLATGGGNVSVSYTSATQIFIPGSAESQPETALVNGQLATVTGAFSGGALVATRIDVTQQPATSVSGTVQSAVYAGTTPVSITIVTNGLPVSYPVSAGVTVTWNATALLFTDLRAGDAVTLSLSGGAATAISVTARATQTLTGTVSNLNPSTQLFTLTAGGTAYTVQYTASTVSEGFGGTPLADGQTVRAEGSFVQGRLLASKLVKQ